MWAKNVGKNASVSGCGTTICRALDLGGCAGDTIAMAVGHLTIDLDAIIANWRALDALSADDVQTAAVIKADAYGLGADKVGPALVGAGVTSFFVAAAEEGLYLRRAVGPMPKIYVFSGHMPGDGNMLEDHALTPLINSIDQLTAQIETLPGRPFGIQLDSGMNRLGLEEAEWSAVRDMVMQAGPDLIMSHLACADEPDHPMNANQLEAFSRMTQGLEVPLSLAATGGILLGPDFHFDVVRPGVGLYGGLPFADATPVARLSLPVIQTRIVEPGESVGYGAAYVPEEPRVIATLCSGYADGLIRAMGGGLSVYAGATPCPLTGRISMDMMAADVSHLEEVPGHLDVLCSQQTVDDLAEAAGTIGYEILTNLGNRTGHFPRELL